MFVYHYFLFFVGESDIPLAHEFIKSLQTILVRNVSFTRIVIFAMTIAMEDAVDVAIVLVFRYMLCFTYVSDQLSLRFIFHLSFSSSLITLVHRWSNLFLLVWIINLLAHWRHSIVIIRLCNNSIVLLHLNVLNRSINDVIQVGFSPFQAGWAMRVWVWNCTVHLRLPYPGSFNLLRWWRRRWRCWFRSRLWLWFRRYIDLNLVHLLCWLLFTVMNLMFDNRIVYWSRCWCL